jgi:hypothetical protein
MGPQFPPGQRPAWLNERGAFLPEKLPLDSTLARALSGDKGECREAVRLLGVMRQSGRVEAGIYLMGLLAGAPWFRYRGLRSPAVLRVARSERL